jgi:hypothetical protein
VVTSLACCPLVLVLLPVLKNTLLWIQRKMHHTHQQEEKDHDWHLVGRKESETPASGRRKYIKTTLLVLQSHSGYCRAKLKSVRRTFPSIQHMVMVIPPYHHDHLGCFSGAPVRCIGVACHDSITKALRQWCMPCIVKLSKNFTPLLLLVVFSKSPPVKDVWPRCRPTQ